MPIYFLDTAPSDDNKNHTLVHMESCSHLPLYPTYLGSFANGRQAVEFAISLGYSDSNGCPHCCKEAHEK